MFRNEWTSEVLLGIFQTFTNYFNKGFCKLVKNESVLTTIVRVFIDNFLNYYFDELIYTIRTINKKDVKDLTVAKYRFKFIKFFETEVVSKKDKDKDKDKKDKDKARSQTLDKNDATQIKDLDNIVSKHNSWMKNPIKYNMSLKIMTDDDRKNFNPQNFLEKINKDFRLFAEFFEGFKEGTKEPFTKHFSLVLGDNFMGTYLNKFNTALEVIRSSKKDLQEIIKSSYKEFFHGTDGKMLMEILICCRKDAKDFLKNATEKKLMSDIYDARIG